MILCISGIICIFYFVNKICVVSRNMQQPVNRKLMFILKLPCRSRRAFKRENKVAHLSRGGSLFVVGLFLAPFGAVKIFEKEFYHCSQAFSSHRKFSLKTTLKSCCKHRAFFFLSKMLPETNVLPSLYQRICKI